MKKTTIGEKIIFAERETDRIRKELEFCKDIKSGKIDIKRHFSYLLVKSVYDEYVFDEYEECEFELHYKDNGISKEQFIERKKQEIRNYAINRYKKAVEEYLDIDGIIERLKDKIAYNEDIIKRAKRKHFIQYHATNLISKRVNSPSFVFSKIGSAMVDGFSNKKHLSDAEVLENELN